MNLEDKILQYRRERQKIPPLMAKFMAGQILTARELAQLRNPLPDYVQKIKTIERFISNAAFEIWETRGVIPPHIFPNIIPKEQHWVDEHGLKIEPVYGPISAEQRLKNLFLNCALEVMMGMEV